MTLENPRRHTIDVDSLQQQLSVRQVASYYGFTLPESFGDAGEQRMCCPCASCSGRNDERGSSLYGGEAVTQEEHALQAAMLTEDQKNDGVRLCCRQIALGR